jgi:hypothetical protein
MVEGDPMAQATTGRSTLVTGVRVTTLFVTWLAVVYLVAPRIGLYYETLAVLYTVPPLALVYAYCLSHPRRATAILAVAATVVALFLIGFAVVIPKGSAA